MIRKTDFARLVFTFSTIFLLTGVAFAQKSPRANPNDEKFGPVMRAYLGYLRNEQEVVDDRISRREISPGYYRRNSERIRALRQMAVHLVTQSGNDYVPELEAVTVDEFGTLFEQPPRTISLRTNEILTNKFRYLGAVHFGEVFYLFARLDPYEQAALIQQQSKSQTSPSAEVDSAGAKGQPVGQATSRPRRTAPNR